MDIVAAVITPVVQIMLGSIKKHLGMVVSSSDHIRDMQEKVRELERLAKVMDNTLMENKAKNLVVPENSVQKWLAEVEIIKQRKESVVPNDGVGCFNIKKRYRAGKRSLDIVKKIDSLMKEKDDIKWSDERKPLSIVSGPAKSTTVNQDVFESRVSIFNAALNSLNPKSNDTQMLALCGMGGVGKTTMMDQLEKAVKENQMYDHVVKVVVGQKPDPIVLQRAVAAYTNADGEDLRAPTKDARAKLLQDKFERMSEQGKKNILVMLDDVWECFDLNDIGLTSPLPNGTKLLLTSRVKDVCTQMGVRDNSIFTVAVLEEAEARKLFWETRQLGLHSDIELDLRQIGEDIVKRCGGLPLPITIIAATLRENNEKDEWKDTLHRLPKSVDPRIKAAFEISYENLRNDELKAIFLLCGLFPEDYNISKEEILRCGWGVKLFTDVHTLEKARIRVNTCANILVRANLLLKSDSEGCVKMHDLVRDFVLNNSPNVKQASIANHNGNVSAELIEKESYERILVNCGGMSEFPKDFNHPNLTLLMLLGRGEQLKFPEDFYTRLGKLEVVAYKNIRQPLLPRYLTNLQALSLRFCTSVGEDISFLGDLINLEVLDLAYCGIHMLPSKIGNLRKLKLLDLTNCKALRIDDGVIQNLDKLEELYMKVSDPNQGITFTDANLKELEILSRKLCALEFEFYKNTAQPKAVSFEKLEKFRISIGCSLSDINSDSFKKTLQLVTTSSELFECKIDELLGKTEVLHLEMKDLNNLEDISTHSPQHSFRNLTSLCVSGSVYLTRLFTISVAKELSKLENLVIKSCPTLKEVWSCEIASSGDEAHIFPMLRKIVVKDCNSIVNLFPSNPMRLLSCLNQLEVEKCGSIEVLFNIDLSEIAQFNHKSNLRSIRVKNLAKLGAIWRINDAENNHSSLVINCFESVECLRISGCKKFRNIVTPTTSNFDMRAIKDITIECSINEEGSQQQEVGTTPNEEIVEVGVVMSIAALPSTYETSLNFHNLRSIRLNTLQWVESVFEIESPRNRDQSVTSQQQQQQPQPQPLLPSLERLNLSYMDRLSHVWKCNNWNKFFVLHEHQPQSSSLQNLTSIQMQGCKSIKYLFSPLMMKLLRSLKSVEILFCDGMEEVVSNRDDEDEEMMTSTSVHTTTTLDLLMLCGLKNLQHIGGGQYKLISQMDIISWSFCQYPKHLYIEDCDALSSVIPYYAAGQMEKLQVLCISRCRSLKEVFETKEITNPSVTIPIPRNITIHKFPNLKDLEIEACDFLENIFTFSTIESLRKLETLEIKGCAKIKVIVKEQHGEQATASSKDLVEFPRLKSVVLDDLPSLVGFFLGMNVDFYWPLLAYVKISDCPQMTVFVSGQSTTPRLEYVHTKHGKHKLECGLNFHPIPTSHQKPTSNSDGISSHPTLSDGRQLWSFHNLIECNLNHLYDEKKIFPSSELQQLQKLELIHANYCPQLEEVFEVASAETHNESQIVVTFPMLRKVELWAMDSLTSIWKSNQWRKLEFPNLTRIHIRSCRRLEYVFTRSMVRCVMQLQELHIEDCKNMKVIVKEQDEEDIDAKVNGIVFPCLKSLKLYHLLNLEGFSLGKEEFTFSTLDTLVIKDCPKVKVFTQGWLVTPELLTVETDVGSFNCLGKDLNSFIRTKIEGGFIFAAPKP